MLICCIHWLCDWSFYLYNLHLLFCCILSILALIWLVLVALFCTAVQRDSVSLISIPFLCHVHVCLCMPSLLSRLKCPSSCFSSHVWFLFIVLLILMLSVLFLVAVISLPPNFSSRLQVVVLMRQHCLQCWQFLLFLTYIFCQRHHCDVMPYAFVSSSSYRAGSTDIPDPLSPLLPIVHRPR